jgi:hypothetical protein
MEVLLALAVGVEAFAEIADGLLLGFCTVGEWKG